MDGVNRLETLLVLTLFALLTVVLTWPVTRRVDEVLVGDDYDVYINMWANWWTQRAIQEGSSLYHTSHIFFPGETSLAFFSFSHVNTASWLLLVPLLGRIAAYNVTMLLVYVLSGFSMYVLVRHLTHSRRAGFVAGLVFAFCPYHMYESAHPNLAAVQWMPLFVLALHRILRDTEAGWFKQPILGALWFLLTALSGWHLMLLLVAWAAVYLLCESCAGRASWAPSAPLRLLLLVVFIAVSIVPFVWPIAHDFLTTDATFATVEIEEGLGNDLLSFILPHQRHPFLSAFVARTHDEIGYATRRPAYVGWATLGLVVWGVAAGGRRSRVWLLSGLVFAFLSLGSQIEFSGTALLPFRLPWAVPIIEILRHPYRFNTPMFLSLAILAGIGVKSLCGWAALRSHRLAEFGPGLVSGVILLEYLVHPFPTTEPLDSPFVRRLAEEPEEFAVADFPMGRQPDKRYMFYQTIHEKRIVGGFVSRAPDDAYAFVAQDPLLGPLLAAKSPDPDLDIRKCLTSLAAHDIRYILLHQDLLDRRSQKAWRERLRGFPPPVYEDSSLIAYRTLPNLQLEDVTEAGQRRIDVQIGDHIQLLSHRLEAGDLSVGDVLHVTLFWQSDGQISDSYHVFVHLVDERGQLVAQHDGVPRWGALPTWSWWEGEIIEDRHSLILDSALPDGEYSLYVGMYDFATQKRATAFTSQGEMLPDGAVLLESIEVDHR